MKITLLLGVSGSGKSTWAAKQAGPDSEIVSADHYFYRDGEYMFDPTLLGAAHGQCLRRYIEACQQGRSVIVDNTNCTIAEVAPYIAIARAYGHEPEVVMLRANLQVCVGRNVHGVPEKTIRIQIVNLARLRSEWPVWWPEIHEA